MTDTSITQRQTQCNGNSGQLFRAWPNLAHAFSLGKLFLSHALIVSRQGRRTSMALVRCAPNMSDSALASESVKFCADLFADSVVTSVAEVCSITANFLSIACFRPNRVKFDPNFADIRPIFGPNFWPISATFARFRSNLDQIRPVLGQIWANLANFGPDSSTCWSTSVEFVPILATCLPFFVDFGRTRPDFGPNLARTLSPFGDVIRIWTNLG